MEETNRLTNRKFCLIACLNHINVPVLAHAGHIGTDRSLLTGHNALLLQQIARDLLHALSHGRPLLNQSSALVGMSQ